MAAKTSALLLAATAAAAALALWRRHRRRSTATPPAPQNICADEPLVVVVGLGGVGSHAAQLLVRGGVRRLRLVDFDQVTLSSLNRHATAARADVGRPKAVALRAALLEIAPAGADIEACVALFNAAAAAELLRGGPALVVDCIDDMATKAELLAHCLAERLPLLCALGAGGKADACKLHVGRLDETLNDPVATALLRRMRKAAPAGADENWWEAAAHAVTCVSSSELPRAGLLPLPEGVQKSELGSQPDFRVRVMPVLPPLPAAFGAALAARALAMLGAPSKQPPPRAVPTLAPGFQRKLHQKLLAAETKGRGVPAADVHAALTPDDVTTLVCDVFRQRCAITGARLLDPSRPQFCLCRLDPARPATLTNTLLLTVEAAKRHEAEGLAGLPPALVDHLRRTYAEAFGGRERSAFDDALRAEGLVRDEAPLDNAPAARLSNAEEQVLPG